MANRKVLRALQTRLAERLQAVQTEGGAGLQWLAVQVGAQHYLIPLSQAGEIFPWQAPKSVPYTQPWFWGVANLRGNLMGVVDLAKLLGHPVQRTEQRVTQASIITVHPSLEVNSGVVVDQLLGLRGENDFVQELPPLDEASYLGPRYEDADGVLWQELLVPALTQSTDFLQVRV